MFPRYPIFMLTILVLDAAILIALLLRSFLAIGFLVHCVCIGAFVYGSHLTHLNKTLQRAINRARIRKIRAQQAEVDLQNGKCLS